MTAQEEVLLKRHGELFREFLPERRPLPGAVELLRTLRTQAIPFGIATSGSRPEIDLSLVALGVGPETVVIERRDVNRAKPEPDLFLACQARLGVPAGNCYASATRSGTCSQRGGPAC
ncbi:MAG: HAD family hydrolase, partial [Gammaproteobacteria bacterium]|nr:HAD family hydrolase [Gammaproteobacteria bacterium]